MPLNPEHWIFHSFSVQVLTALQKQNGFSLSNETGVNVQIHPTDQLFKPIVLLETELISLELKSQRAC